MALPQSYVDENDYFRDSLNFLRDNDWLFRYSNIQILVEGLLERFDKEWQPVLENISNDELNEIPFGYNNEDWPESLKYYVKKIEKLKPTFEIPRFDEIKDLPKDFDRKLGDKKKHEILSLAPVIHKYCNDVDVIVDIGAGLGYLPQILYEKFKYKILAIEGNEEKCELARRRQANYYPQSENHVRFVRHYVSNDSDNDINEYVSKFLKADTANIKIGLVGLHACADLTITMLKLFNKMSNVKNIVVMPCCYHRLQNTPGKTSEQRFLNFPCSGKFRNVYEEENGAAFLTAPFLRLSGQSSASSRRKMSTDEHRKHATGVLRRCILELASKKEGYKVSCYKRKCKTVDSEISTYINGLKNNYELTDLKTNESVPIERIYDQVKTLWKENERLLQMIEVFTAFQTTIQAVGENIILLDRLWMVREWGWSCDAVKVANDELSPRCFAVVAKK